MNLVNKKVTHKVFGTGSIVKHNDKFVEINFETENKKFLFPDVFEKHVKLHDESVATTLEKVIEKREEKRKVEEMRRQEQREIQRKEQELRMEHEKLMKNHKLHPVSQMVYWCDEEQQKAAFEEWQVFSGEIKSGKNQGQPNKPVRLHQNSACLLTERDSNEEEKERRILGAYMVKEDFIGKLCEDGIVPAHTEFRIQLTEEESEQLLFWNYYVNEKYPERMTWNTGQYRYFNNEWMAQILVDIIALKKDPAEKELAQRFLDHFCKMNLIKAEELPEPNGALKR